MAKAVLFKLYFVALFCLSSLVDLVSGSWCPSLLGNEAIGAQILWVFTVHMESGHSVAKDVFYNLCMLTSI